MVTQAEKDAISREFDDKECVCPSWVEYRLDLYRWHRQTALRIMASKELRRGFIMLALSSRRAYWGARKAAGV